MSCRYLQLIGRNEVRISESLSIYLNGTVLVIFKYRFLLRNWRANGLRLLAAWQLGTVSFLDPANLTKFAQSLTADFELFLGR